MKRLYKSRKNKVIDGVCGGIAEYFDVDPTIVRVLFIIFFLFGGSALIAYILGVIIIPREPVEFISASQPTANASAQPEGATTSENAFSPTPTPQQAPVTESSNAAPLIIGVVLVLMGAFFLLDNFHPFRQMFWWFRHNFWNFFFPGLIVAAGLALIIKGSEGKK